jgi:hypothetical protein
MTAIIRLCFLPRLLLQIDVSWNVLPVSILDQAEQCLGMVTASIPALTALISRSRGRLSHRFRPGPGHVYELSTRSRRPAKRTVPSPADFDFLAYAYDPDDTSVVYATAYAGNKRRVRGKGFRFTSDENLVEDDGVRWQEPGTISKTTTVEVRINRR